jgi:hypothetical protein
MRSNFGVITTSSGLRPANSFIPGALPNGLVDCRVCGPAMVVFAPWEVTSAFSAAGAPERSLCYSHRQPARPVRPIRLWPARLPQPVLAFAEPLWPSPFPMIEGETSLCGGYVPQRPVRIRCRRKTSGID